MSGNTFDTIKFGFLVNLFNKLSTLRSRKKSDYLKMFVKILFKNNRKPDFTYSVLRLILPAEDRERGNYGVKERNLAVIVKECFNLTKEQYERLKHFKNPNYHQGGVGIGDFAICLYDVIKGVCNQKSELTVKRLN
jgi:DNA ligase-4